ncbi:MAG: hypothetical protein HGA44_10750 [Cellulomonadaceae bacterium]|nr:hypothetical protein [Cellulomonadaceae bacterium]
MTTATPLGSGGFVAYEYTTIRVGRDLEPLYRDAYTSFGWAVDGYGPTPPNVASVTLRLKRDRRMTNRAALLELQRTCENALRSIANLERAKNTAAMAWALGLGIVGSGLIAASVLATAADLIAVSIPLGVLGLVGWLAGYVVHGRVQASRTTRLAPLIDRQYDVVYETSEQASQLLPRQVS